MFSIINSITIKGKQGKTDQDVFELNKKMSDLKKEIKYLKESEKRHSDHIRESLKIISEALDVVLPDIYENIANEQSNKIKIIRK
jgi:hypothetical protein